MFVAGRTAVADVDRYVARLRAIGDEHGATVQAFDARYVVDRTHIERAVELADRARARGEAIADSRAMEILCYAAGTRQITEALEIGVPRGEARSVVLVDGGDEAGAAAAIRATFEAERDPDAVFGSYDETRVREFYGIGDAELSATDAGVPDLVRERVALLVVER